jgi:hypothetical protein
MGIHFGPLVLGKTATGMTPSAGPNQLPGVKTFHAQITGSGAVSCTIELLGSNIAGTSTVRGNYVALGAITISGTSVVSDGFAAQSPWKWYAANVTVISGSGASIDIYVGEDAK